MASEAFFITVKDLMVLHNSNSYEAMRRLHQNIRECLTSKSNKLNGRTKAYLTIKEYCTFQDLDMQEVLTFLQSSRTKPGSKE
jgi:hypothetical protein